MSVTRHVPFSFCLLILCAALVMPRFGQAAEKAYTNVPPPVRARLPGHQHRVSTGALRGSVNHEVCNLLKRDLRRNLLQ